MSDEDDVLVAFDALDGPWAGRDVEGVVRLFADQPDITFWGDAGPERAVGREELRDMLTRLFAAYATGSFRIGYTERRVSVFGDVAVVNAAGEATWDPGDWTEEVLPYRLTGVFVRTADGWRWHTHHGSEPTPLDP